MLLAVKTVKRDSCFVYFGLLLVKLVGLSIAYCFFFYHLLTIHDSLPMKTSANVVKTSASVTTNSPPQYYTQLDDHTSLTFESVLFSITRENVYLLA